jgi:dihydropyrimidinase
MSDELVFRNGVIVNSDGVVHADLLVKEGKITAIGASLGSGDAEVVDASGRYLLPGGVDVHTHLELPAGGTISSDDFFTGTVAAACGGTTTVVDFASQEHGQKLPEAIAEAHCRAADKAVVDYGFHVAVTDLYKDAIVDLREIVSDGVSSFKVYLAYPGVNMIGDGDLYRVLQAGGQLGATVCVHAENGTVIDEIAADLFNSGKRGPESHALSRPPETEVEAVQRAIMIARIAESPVYFVHLSTRGATEAVAEARLGGWPVSAETCTHYLTLTETEYDGPHQQAMGAVLTPPLRSEDHQKALWQGLDNGSLSIVSSDHCPFCKAQKALGEGDFRKIPNGGPGIEHRLQLLYGEGVATGRVTLERFVDLVSASPAKSFGMYPRKGVIQVGSDADIVLLNPSETTTLSATTSHQRVDYSLWEGKTVPGRVEKVYSAGELIFSGGIFTGSAGRGQFIPRAPR